MASPSSVNFRSNIYYTNKQVTGHGLSITKHLMDSGESKACFSLERLEMEGNRFLVVMHGSKRKHCVLDYSHKCTHSSACRELLIVDGMHCRRERVESFLCKAQENYHIVPG